MKEAMLKRIEYFAEQKQGLAAHLTEYFKDLSIPLEERWEVFCSACSKDVFENIHGWIWHSKILEDELKLEWYDDFNTERHETVYFTDLIERIEENYFDVKCGDEMEDDSYELEEIPGNGWTFKTLDRLKEEILESGYSGFVFDW